MKVVFVVGPTASGKSALALEFAQKFQGVIVNCDSIQCYQSLDIGSAKPSLSERSLVPHELFDYIPEGETLTAGAYARDFFATLEKLKQRDVESVFVVGGTGFYFQAIEKGMYDIGAADPQKIAELEAKIRLGELDQLRAELERRDPETARRIAQADHYRLVRALEMIATHGKTPTQVKNEFEAQRKPFPFPLIKVGIKAQRQDLLEPIHRRTENMLEMGLLEEVSDLLQRGLKDWAPLSSVGYKECRDYILGESAAKDQTELQELIETATHQLAKKQRTWFSRDGEIHWGSYSAARTALLPVIERFFD